VRSSAISIRMQFALTRCNFASAFVSLFTADFDSLSSNMILSIDDNVLIEIFRSAVI